MHIGRMPIAPWNEAVAEEREFREHRKAREAPIRRPRSVANFPHLSALAAVLVALACAVPAGSGVQAAGTYPLVTYAVQQELIPSRPDLGEVFVRIDP